MVMGSDIAIRVVFERNVDRVKCILFTHMQLNGFYLTQVVVQCLRFE